MAGWLVLGGGGVQLGDPGDIHVDERDEEGLCDAIETNKLLAGASEGDTRFLSRPTSCSLALSLITI